LAQKSNVKDQELEATEPNRSFEYWRFKLLVNIYNYVF